jgi:hypothetical protein
VGISTINLIGHKNILSLFKGDIIPKDCNHVENEKNMLKIGCQLSHITRPVLHSQSLLEFFRALSVFRQFLSDLC